MSILEIMCCVHDNIVEPELPFPEILNNVLAGKIVALHNVFFPFELDHLRLGLFSWKETIPHEYSTNQNTFVETRSETHWYRSYDIDMPEEMPEYLNYWLRLKTLYNSISQNQFTWANHNNLLPIALRPQLMQYPNSGGFLHWHTHPFEPQIIGHVTNMAKAEEGGWTEFSINQKEISTKEIHKVGTTIIFRNDIPHRVVPNNPDLPYDTASTGRWSMLMPYKTGF